MNELPRYYQNLEFFLKSNKALVIFGPRQVGKTTLIQHYLAKTTLKYRFVSGDDIQMQTLLSTQRLDVLTEFVAGYELLVIDEAQKIPNIGLNLKLLVDHVPSLKILVTGSASFELAGQIGEPLTGRKITLQLFPIAQLELLSVLNRYDLKQRLETFLIYGSYPEVIVADQKEEKQRIITEITQSYLLKDILELDRIKSSKILLDLLRLIAFQVGNAVSLSELATQLGIDYKTVARYLDLFEKSFILYNLRGFSRNLRTEITKKSKYYFYDTGVRNALISNFNPIKYRNDIGAIWENFLFIERLKKQRYFNLYANNYFWRTWTQQEIDLIEEREGKLFGYEFKWNKKVAKAPSQWVMTYENGTFETINQENYLDFIS